MTTQNLPTDDLKKYGIFNSDNTFTKKLSEEDIQYDWLDKFYP